MGGGLMQLVAYGAQDIYLTGNPQITFFKVVYRRHTNFSMETIQQTINGTPQASGTSTVTISRNGDLVYKVYVTSTDPTITQGSGLVQQVECEIGGQLIDRHYEEWNQIWWELTTPASKQVGFKAMICDSLPAGTVGICQVPLNFWFCRNPGLALPLIALQYHEVKLKCKWSDTAADLTVSPQVWVDYIYLDTDERRRFAQVSHEYLIEQIQKQSASVSTSNKLNFNHPVKEIIWTSNRVNTYTNAKIVLNGHDRFAAQVEEYFQLRQPYDYHTAIPGQNIPEAGQHLMHTSKRILRSADATLPGTAADVEVEVTQPAGTILTHVKIVCTEVVEVSSGDIGYRIGTASDGVQLVAEQTDEILDGGTAVALGAITYPGMGVSLPGGTDAATAKVAIDAAIRSGFVHDVQDDTSHIIDVCYTASERTLFCTIQPTTDAVTGKFCFIFEYEHLNQADVTSGQASAHGCFTSQMIKKINVYSFALKPEEHQPSGTCNFSRIDSAQLRTGLALAADDNIYAVNYNVLRIMSGMGGLAYSN